MKKLIIGLMFCILFLSLVSAADWDNKQTYDLDKREYLVENLGGLGGDIARVKLITPNIVYVGTGYQKVAEYEINSYSDYDN